MKKYTDYIVQFNSSKCNSLKKWINTTLFNYLKKNAENQGEIEHILDYLADTKKEV